jgi:hypothetical protein
VQKRVIIEQLKESGRAGASAIFLAVKSRWVMWKRETDNFDERNLVSALGRGPGRDLVDPPPAPLHAATPCRVGEGLLFLVSAGLVGRASRSSKLVPGLRKGDSTRGHLAWTGTAVALLGNCNPGTGVKSKNKGTRKHI